MATYTKFNDLQHAIDAIASKQQHAATLTGNLKSSLTLQQLRPDIFKHGPVKLRRIGAMLPAPSRDMATISAALVDVNNHRHPLTAQELATFKPGLAIHPNYRT